MTFDGRLLSGVTVLAAVAEAGSFVRAADALGLSTSGVSRAISRLEARVSARLLDRTTRSLTLTDQGRQFYESIQPHLEGIEAAAVVASGSTNVVRGRLRVNVDPFFARYSLAAALTSFLDRYPDLSLELIMRDDVGDLVADGFDLAVRFGQPPGGSLIARKLIDTRVLTVASPDYIARHGRPAHPDELDGHKRILFYNPITRRPFEWEFWRKDEVVVITPSGRLLVSDVGAMVGACAAGAGIAQILAIGTEELMRRGDLIDLFPDWPGELFPLYALYPSRRHLAAKVRIFVEFCLSTFAKDNLLAV
jgi:DNA-binding transcriptional LysR family regulator